MSCNSASVGFWPRERITVPISFVVMVPSPSLSNREKASLNSAICSCTRDFRHRPHRQQSARTPQAKLMDTAPQSAGRPWRAIENAGTARTCEPLELKLGQSSGRRRVPCSTAVLKVLWNFHAGEYVRTCNERSVCVQHGTHTDYRHTTTHH
eukprot:s7146_g2.t1